MSTINIKDVTKPMCSQGKRIALAWYAKAGKPSKITANHVFKVLKVKYKGSRYIQWWHVMQIICNLLTTRQIERLVIATKGKVCKYGWKRRDYRGITNNHLAYRLLRTLHNNDRIKVLEYTLSRKK